MDFHWDDAELNERKDLEVNISVTYFMFTVQNIQKKVGNNIVNFILNLPEYFQHP